jgi:hypothetical protein
MPDIHEHVDWVFDSHQEVVHLVEFSLVSDHFSQQVRVQLSVPEQESAASSLTHVGFPVTNQVELPVPEGDLLKSLSFEALGLHKVHAVADDGTTKLVIATSVTLQNSDHQLQHIVEIESLLHLVHILSTSFDQSGDQLTSVSVNKHHPSIDKVLLGLKLNLYSLEHLNGFHNNREVPSASLSTMYGVLLSQNQECLERPLNLSSELNTIGHKISSDLHEVFIALQSSIVLQVVRVHLGNPLDL